jgi:hypothetical protein
LPSSNCRRTSAALYQDAIATSNGVPARGSGDALHPYSAGGAYVNFLMEEGREQVTATYRDNYDRLVATKGQHDPTNLFRVNQNIRPSR